MKCLFASRISIPPIKNKKINNNSRREEIEKRELIISDPPRGGYKYNKKVYVPIRKVTRPVVGLVNTVRPTKKKSFGFVGSTDALKMYLDMLSKMYSIDVSNIDNIDELKIKRRKRSLTGNLPDVFVSDSNNGYNILINIDNEDKKLRFPYPSLNNVQLEYVPQFVEQIVKDNRCDILISAPTGTGKSEGVIYSILHSLNILHGMSLLNTTVINYFSRTHYQLSQFIKRLNEQNVYQIWSTEIGTRHRSCNLYKKYNNIKYEWNEDLSNAMFNVSTLVFACNKCKHHSDGLRKYSQAPLEISNECPHYVDYQNLGGDFYDKFSDYLSDGNRKGVCIDIEDFSSTLEDCVGTLSPCSYFTQHTLMKKKRFHIVAQPYNYMDKLTKPKQNISIINIIDEAHNVASAIREIQTVTIPISDIIEIKDLFKHVIKTLVFKEIPKSKLTLNKIQNLGFHDSLVFNGRIKPETLGETVPIIFHKYLNKINNYLTNLTKLFINEYLYNIYSNLIHSTYSTKYELYKKLQLESTKQIGELIETSSEIETPFLEFITQPVQEILKLIETSPILDYKINNLIHELDRLQRNTTETGIHSGYIITFNNNYNIDNLKDITNIFNIIKPFFDISKWRLTFAACDSTLFFRKMKSTSEMNILMSGTFDQRGIAILDLFGDQPFRMFVTKNHVFNPKKCLHYVLPYFHPSVVIPDSLDVKINWTYTARNVKYLDNNNSIVTGEYYVLKSMALTIYDVAKFANNCLLIFMQSKKMASALERDLLILFRNGVNDFTIDWDILPVDRLHTVDGIENILDNYLIDTPIRKGIIITWARSILSEGIDIKSGTMSAILIGGLPWANKSEDSPRKRYFSKLINTESADVIDSAMYISDMRNSINQTIGRLGRSPTASGIVIIHDSRYLSKYFPNWANDNETKPISGTQTVCRHRIDTLRSRESYISLINEFKNTQINK
jgi:Rad3-related DNA helicase